VGGIPSVVSDCVTGALFDIGASGEDYADHVWRLMEDRRRYEEMALAAFDEYQRNLNWGVQAREWEPDLPSSTEPFFTERPGPRMLMRRAGGSQQAYDPLRRQ
jgi:hypothetical protein